MNLNILKNLHLYYIYITCTIAQTYEIGNNVTTVLKELYTENYKTQLREIKENLK